MAHRAHTGTSPCSELASVLAQHDVEWHVAQHGDVAADDDLRRLAPGAAIVEGTLHPLGDMASFADELLQLDAVVTVDNTLLHLGGGVLRILTFALISAPAYWAWPSAGTESRWYASVTLLRQSTPGARRRGRRGQPGTA